MNRLEMLSTVLKIEKNIIFNLEKWDFTIKDWAWPVTDFFSLSLFRPSKKKNWLVSFFQKFYGREEGFYFYFLFWSWSFDAKIQ